MAAYALGTTAEMRPRSPSAWGDWARSLVRQLELYRWLQSSEGQLCLTILPLAAVLILLASVAGIQNKRLDARRAAATPKDIHVPPRPEEREDERK